MPRATHLPCRAALAALALAALAACGVEGPPEPPPPAGLSITGEARIGVSGRL